MSNAFYYQNLDHDKLDEIVKSGNSMAAQHKVDIFKNKLREIGICFSYFKEEKMNTMAELSMRRDYPTKIFLKVLDRVVNTCDQFPSFSELRRMIEREIPSAKSAKFELERNIEASKENAEYTKYRDEFIRVLGDDALDKYTQWWVKNTFPELSNGMMAAFNINPSIFERSAIFDWYDAGGMNNNGKCDFDKVKRISKEKLRILETHRKLNKIPTQRICIKDVDNQHV